MLDDGQTGPFLAFLSDEATVADLNAIREQKLLRRIRDASVLESAIHQYKTAVTRLTESPIERSKAHSYADFLKLASSAFDGLSTLSGELISSFASRLGLLDLLTICEDLIAEAQRQTETRFRGEFLKPTDDPANVADATAANEAALQFAGGCAKDIVFAAARTLNEASRSSRGTAHKCANKEAIRNAAEKFRKLHFIAGQWNSLEYALDKVSFGEWFVTSVESEGTLTVTFDESDPLLVKARDLGNRREIVHNTVYRKTEERFLRTFLKDQVPRSILAAANHFGERFRRLVFTRPDYDSVEPRLLSLLGYIDADDDLLLAAAPECLPSYHAAFLLRCFREVSIVVLSKMNKQVRRSVRRIPLSMSAIAAATSMGADYQRELLQELRAATLTLPLKNHLDLVDRPFVRIDDDQVYPLLHFDSTSWLSSVRQQCVYGGARTNAFGRIWEKFVAESLKDHGWEILATSLKLKKKGRTLTDIDILGLRDGLLLVIQVKAFARTGINIYEQWLSRNSIVEGIEQAACAARELLSNREQVTSMLPMKRDSLPADVVQPLVVTNWPIFSGWQFNGVPVVGIGELMSILRGGHVKYMAGRSLIEEQSIYEGKTLSRDEFVALLHEPVGFRVARWSEDVQHFSAGAGPIDLQFPFHSDGSDVLSRYVESLAADPRSSR